MSYFNNFFPRLIDQKDVYEINAKEFTVFFRLF